MVANVRRISDYRIEDRSGDDVEEVGNLDLGRESAGTQPLKGRGGGARMEFDPLQMMGRGNRSAQRVESLSGCDEKLRIATGGLEDALVGRAERPLDDEPAELGRSVERSPRLPKRRRIAHLSSVGLVLESAGGVPAAEEYACSLPGPQARKRSGPYSGSSISTSGEKMVPGTKRKPAFS